MPEHEFTQVKRLLAGVLKTAAKIRWSGLFNRSRRVGLGLQYSADGTIHWRRALAAETGLLGAGLAVNRMVDHRVSPRSAARPLAHA